jgi:amidase
MTDPHNHVVMTFRAYVEDRLHWQTPYKGNSMAIERPTIEQLQALASRLNIRLTPAQAEEYLALMQANFDAYDLIDALPDEIPAVRYPRAAGYRPEGDENPLNAWYYKTEVTGAATGALAGRTVVLKDNIALAGVPMMNGASTLEGFVPLRRHRCHPTAGCRRDYSRQSHLRALLPVRRQPHLRSGPVHNPLRHGYSAGGSSSGSAALVASGEVDMAIGCDQGARRVFPPPGVASMA